MYITFELRKESIKHIKPLLFTDELEKISVKSTRTDTTEYTACDGSKLLCTVTEVQMNSDPNYGVERIVN